MSTIKKYQQILKEAALEIKRLREENRKLRENTEIAKTAQNFNNNNLGVVENDDIFKSSISSEEAFKAIFG